MKALGSVRSAATFTDMGASVVAVGDLSAQTDWSEALAGVELGGAASVRQFAGGYFQSAQLVGLAAAGVGG